MYTAHKHLQILIALLKKHGVTHLVLSPGARSIPFVRSVEIDSDFICYSVVDERSAAFFAMGLAQELGQPVGLACTSSTATCNYYSAVVEAYYQQVPLVLLTFDRDPYLIGQMENQMIEQKRMYGPYCQTSITIPQVKDNRDFEYCQRIVNEALLEMIHRGGKPVQINIPVFNADAFNVKQLPEVKKIERLVAGSQYLEWKQKKDVIRDKKILFVFGQGKRLTKEEEKALERFCEQYDCAIATEHMANVHNEYTILTYGFAETVGNGKFEDYMPDLLISYGGNVSGRLKDLFRSRTGQVEHWSIREDGKLIDIFKNLSVIYESTLLYFLEYFLDVDATHLNQHEYYKKWKNAVDSIKVDNVEFSNFYVAKKLSEMAQKNSIIHTGILNSTRQMNFFKLDDSIEYYSNIGAFGIDGTMSTFLGQSVATDKICYLLLGDLSFLYDMNSVSIRHLKGNVRIIVVNNGGGGEFHYIMGKERIPTIDKHISAGHHHSIQGWIESLGFEFYSAHDKEEFDLQFEKFIKYDGNVPAVMEVFTDMEEDARITKQVITNLRQEEITEKLKRETLDVGRKLLHSWQRKEMEKEKK